MSTSTYKETQVSMFIKWYLKHSFQTRTIHRTGKGRDSRFLRSDRDSTEVKPQ